MSKSIQFPRSRKMWAIAVVAALVSVSLAHADVGTRLAAMRTLYSEGSYRLPEKKAVVTENGGYGAPELEQEKREYSTAELRAVLTETAEASYTDVARFRGVRSVLAPK